MSRIQDKFTDLKSRNEKALIAYFMGGYPNEKDTISAIRGSIKGGADIIEIGFPFSDPLADGPVIQNASTISLQKGFKMNQFFKIVKKIRSETNIPLVLMTYTNVIYKQGYDKFLNNAKKAGIDGMILPDMAVEESNEYLKSAKKNSVDTIFLISPNTSKQRIKKIENVTSGFLYLVSMYGTTGMKTKVQSYSTVALKNTKKIVSKKIPVAVGFGINDPQDVKKFISNGADAVIVGSAFLRLIEKTPSNKIMGKIEEFTKKLKTATT